MKAFKEDIKAFKEAMDDVLQKVAADMPHTSKLNQLTLLQHALAEKYNIEAGGNAEDTKFLTCMEFYDELVKIKSKHLTRIVTWKSRKND